LHRLSLEQAVPAGFALLSWYLVFGFTKYFAYTIKVMCTIFTLVASIASNIYLGLQLYKKSYQNRSISDNSEI